MFYQHLLLVRLVPLPALLLPGRYKLTARDMGPHARCVGDDVPPPQPWQFPLPPPPPPTELPNFDDVREAISRAIVEPNPVLPPDE